MYCQDKKKINRIFDMYIPKIITVIIIVRTRESNNKICTIPENSYAFIYIVMTFKSCGNSNDSETKNYFIPSFV